MAKSIIAFNPNISMISIQECHRLLRAPRRVYIIAMHLQASSKNLSTRDRLLLSFSNCTGPSLILLLSDMALRICAAIAKAILAHRPPTATLAECRQQCLDGQR